MARSILQTDILRFKVWTQDTNGEQQACVTTFDYDIDLVTYVPGVTDASLAVAYDTAIATLFKNLISSNCTYKGVQLTYLNVVPLPATQFSNGNAGAGTGAAVITPTQCRGLTTRLTQFAGPSKRGRIFWPFPSTTEIGTLGAPTGSYLTKITNTLATLAPVTGATYISGGGTVKILPILWHRALHNYDAIAAYRNEAGFATQRKGGFYGRSNVSPI